LSINARVMKRPLVIEEERINFTEKEEYSPEEGILLMTASVENGEQR
ncbi:MAG TPA: glycosyl transferase, partial [Lachnoclostridium sp.]|nr:glycosyl transferase [Lachnoclostridium sp.]